MEDKQRTVKEMHVFYISFQHFCCVTLMQWRETVRWGVGVGGQGMTVDKGQELDSNPRHCKHIVWVLIHRDTKTPRKPMFKMWLHKVLHLTPCHCLWRRTCAWYLGTLKLKMMKLLKLTLHLHKMSLKMELGNDHFFRKTTWTFFFNDAMYSFSALCTNVVFVLI